MASERALVIVDTQNDFCEGGSLPVAGGAQVASAITEYVSRHASDYWVILATKDYHVDPKGHFSDEPDYINTWPPHCVVGTSGCEFHPNLDASRIRHTFFKGLLTPAYSGFEGVCDIEGKEVPDGLDDNRYLGLEIYLKAQGVATVDIVGLATDYCVRATALDAAALGFHTSVLSLLCAGVAPESTRTAINEMVQAGVEWV